MKKITYTCDKCGCKIVDVVFELYCWAENLNGEAWDDANRQNIAQNITKQKYTRHLCRECKNELTDGIFIV